MEQLELGIDELLLDLENPRIVAVESQAEALEAIINLNTRYFETMMESIKEHGLDPGDSLYIIEADDDDYVVVEGNRRFAAIMILDNPDLLESTNLTATAKKRLIRIASGFKRKSIEPIRCTLFKSRKSANEWIERRHTGGKEGEGRIDWGPLEKQRFEGDRTVLDVIEFVERNNADDPSWSDVKDAVQRNSSTVDRFLKSRAGKSALGIKNRKSNGESVPYFDRKPEYVLDVLKRLFEDIHAGEVDSRSHNKADDIHEYFDSLPKPLKPAKSNEGEEAAFRDVTIAPRKSSNSAKSKSAKKTTGNSRRTTRVKPARRTLAPKTVSFEQPKTSKGQALLREASKVKLDELPLGAAFLLRAFLQHSIDYYMTKNKLPFRETKRGKSQELSLQQRFERVKKHVIDAGLVTTQDLRGVTSTLTTKTDPASIQSLNDYHHNTYRVPTADVLRSAWDSAEPLFIAIHGEA